MTPDRHVPRIGNVLYPVADVPAAAAFYRNALDLTVMFLDGGRYAALDAASTTLALAAGTENLANGRTAASFEVADVDAAMRAFSQAGGTLLGPPEQGPHEVRTLVCDPWDNMVVIYSSSRKRR